MNFYPPNVNDYFLVTDKDGKNKCVANENNCMTMNVDKECLTCYPDSAYNYLNNKMCVKCALANCNVCGELGKCKECNAGSILSGFG